MEPDLRLVPLASIELQEEPDRKRLERLIAGIRQSRVVRDPPIVTSGIGKKLMQLDGTTRISTLRRLGCSHVVVQYVDYSDSSQVLIKSWVHVSKVNKRDFVEGIQKIPGVKTESFQLGLGLTLTGHPLATITIIFNSGKGLSILGDSDLVQKVLMLKKVVNLYASLIERDREVTIEGMQHLAEFFEKHPEKNVALFFPSFAAQEIYSLLKKGVVLPAGITRHIINGRVLGINYPIKMLGEDVTDEEKQQFFANFLKTIQLRYYEESTFMAE